MPRPSATAHILWGAQTLSGQALIVPDLSLCAHFCTRERWCPPPPVSLMCSPRTSKVWQEVWGGSDSKSCMVSRDTSSVSDPSQALGYCRTTVTSHRGHASIAPFESLQRKTYLTNHHAGTPRQPCPLRLVGDKHKGFVREVAQDDNCFTGPQGSLKLGWPLTSYATLGNSPSQSPGFPICKTGIVASMILCMLTTQQWPATEWSPLRIPV